MREYRPRAWHRLRDGGIVAVLTLLLSWYVPASAGLGSPVSAANGHGPTVSPAVHHDVSPVLRSLKDSRTPAVAHPARHLPIPGYAAQSDPALQRHYAASPLIAGTSTSWDGVGAGFSGPQGTFSVQSAPPDTVGAVGPSHYVQVVNSSLAVWNKTGTVLYGPVATNTLWSGFGGLCQSDNDGDATVSYDRAAGRWVIQQFAVTGTTTAFLDCVAVSQTGDPTGAWYRYSFSYGSSFPDYPKLSVWPDAYYTTFNLFNAAGTSFLGAQACAFNRSAMLAGAAATQQCVNVGTSYGGLLASNVDSSAAPPSGSPAFVVGLGATANTLAYWKFHVDWTTTSNTTLTGPTSLAVASFSQACGGGTCIPQSGTSQQLDSLADRLMYRLSYRNFGDHEAMVVDHAVTAGSGVGMRWYELRPDSSRNLSVFQQGTYAPDANFRWMGSIAMDGSGNAAMGFSLSGSSLHPQIHYTGRLAGDAAGTMTQGEASIIDGAGSQTGQSLSRWGDYSAITVDPSDDCTFWYTNEYIPANGAFNWRTRIGSFKVSSNCGTTTTNDFSIAAAPTSLSLVQGTSGTSTISTAVTSGSAQTVNLSVSGVPSGATASLSPTSVSAGGGSTLTVNAGTAAAGSYTLTVTGTGTSATHATSVALTVTPSGGGGTGITNGGFETGSLSGWTSAGASTGISTTAHSGAYSAQVGSTSPTNGDSSIAQTFTAGSSGNLTFWYRVVCPDTVTYDWATATLRDNTAGTTATVLAKTCTNSGTWAQASGAVTSGHSYTLTLVSHDDNYAGDATYTLYDDVAISAPVANPITNPGFETGSFSGWTSGGASTGISTTAHSGTYSARVGSTSPTNGDSAIAQTFTAPTGSTSLSFYYRVVCPDTVTYDWATATLKDNTAGTTATVLAKTCSNTGSWTQKSAALTAGHSYTLTLISHDDNYSGDPTYTLYDDVLVK